MVTTVECDGFDKKDGGRREQKRNRRQDVFKGDVPMKASGSSVMVNSPSAALVQVCCVGSSSFLLETETVSATRKDE